jgi:hypothetical protein
MLAFSLSILLIAGCSYKNDAIAQAEKQDAVNGVPVPGPEQTKQIAQEGFVYGSPLVLAYAALYQFNVDKTNSQCKAPFNIVSNEARVHVQGHCGSDAKQRASQEVLGLQLLGD